MQRPHFFNPSSDAIEILLLSRMGYHLSLPPSSLLPRDLRIIYTFSGLYRCAKVYFSIVCHGGGFLKIIVLMPALVGMPTEKFYKNLWTVLKIIFYIAKQFTITKAQKVREIVDWNDTAMKLNY